MFEALHPIFEQRGLNKLKASHFFALRVFDADFLMLDEPTNHLDLNAVIWLETYLPIMYREEGRKKPKVRMPGVQVHEMISRKKLNLFFLKKGILHNFCPIFLRIAPIPLPAFVKPLQI